MNCTKTMAGVLAGVAAVFSAEASVDLYETFKDQTFTGEYTGLSQDETYTLSQDYKFQKADGTAVDPADEIVLLAPLAKDGRCPLTLFQIDSKSECAHDDGVYAVYLLDTRAGNGLVTGAAVVPGAVFLLLFAVVAFRRRRR